MRRITFIFHVHDLGNYCYWYLALPMWTSECVYLHSLCSTCVIATLENITKPISSNTRWLLFIPKTHLHSETKSLFTGFVNSNARKPLNVIFFFFFMKFIRTSFGRWHEPRSIGSRRIYSAWRANEVKLELGKVLKVEGYSVFFFFFHNSS